MSIVKLRGFEDDEHAPVIMRNSVNERTFGITLAKKHPPYVFAIRGCSCLVHKIARVELHWYRIASAGRLVRQRRPMAVAHTPCGFFIHLEADRARSCLLPSPDAISCGRCNGDVAPFGKHGFATKAGMKRQEAHVKLGCVVNGY